jgi:PAS domain S-box-containing protein
MPTEYPTEESPETVQSSSRKSGDRGERPQPVAPEDEERVAAWRRGETRQQERAMSPTSPSHIQPRPARVTGYPAFAALADSVRDYAIFLMDAEGVITYWGEGARLIKWWTKDEAEDAHLRMLYPAGGSEDGTAEQHLRDAAERGEYTGEGRRVRSDGSTYWAGVTLTALRDDAGTLMGFAKVTRDLTARRAADSLLQSAAESADAARVAAEAASHAKSAFLATMSHEIRTPVNAIIGYHELLELETDGPLTPGQRRHLARATASGRHLLALISEVLDFSRLEAGRVEVGRGAFKIGDAVSAAIDLVTPDATARQLELVNAVSGYAAGLSARGDDARVRQILVNLLSNAIKFTDARDGEPGRIIISAGTAERPSPDAHLPGDGPWIYVRVEDTGRGVASDRIDDIFEPFVQADMTLTRQHGGTGLGLAISRRLARLMGGDVTARSEAGVGSTFFLWLAAAPVESLQTGGLEGHGPGGEAPPPPTIAELVRDTRAEHPRSESRRAPGAIDALSDVILAEIEPVLHAYVSRLRSDPATPSARAMAEPDIQDHLASFLADVASTLAGLDVAAGVPGNNVRDGTAIQRVIAERHGAQRARLGWSEAEVRREFIVLKEELAAAVRRHAVNLPGPLGARPDEAERALEMLNQSIALAERVSIEHFRRAPKPAVASEP